MNPQPIHPEASGDEQLRSLQSKITTLTAGLLSDLQSPFHASTPLAILAHYDTEFMTLFQSHIEAECKRTQVVDGRWRCPNWACSMVSPISEQKCYSCGTDSGLSATAGSGDKDATA